MQSYERFQKKGNIPGKTDFDVSKNHLVINRDTRWLPNFNKETTSECRCKQMAQIIFADFKNINFLTVSQLRAETLTIT